MKKLVKLFMILLVFIGIGITVSNFLTMDLNAGSITWYGTNHPEKPNYWQGCYGPFTNCGVRVYY